MTKPFSLLRSVKIDKPPREAIQFLTINDDIDKLILEMDELISVDIETKGNKVFDFNSEVIGIGLADSNKIYYIDVKDNFWLWENVLHSLYQHNKQLFGFNINFDAAYFHRDYSHIINQTISGPGLKWHGWLYDCYGLYKQLAGEGWPGQEWNLKSAQIDLLGWEDKGDVELVKWLIDNNHFTSVSLTAKKGYAWDDKQQRFCRPDRSKMYLAPTDILGYYCGLDAASTYMLLAEVFIPTVESLPIMAQQNFWFYHTELFITNVKWHIEQQLRGIKINKDELIKYTKVLSEEITDVRAAFFNNKTVVPLVKEFNLLQAGKLLGQEPARLTKAGKVSKNHINWLLKKEKLYNMNHFNMDSGLQRQWLFYEKLKYPVLLRTENGNPAVDKKALLNWGPIGQILKKNNDKTKELSYVTSCIEQLNDSPDGRLHPQYRLPGTLTCRIAGAGKFNVQQQPKSKGYLKHWVPSEDYLTWIDCYSDDTEILTNSGWKFFQHIDVKEHEILTYNKDTQKSNWQYAKGIISKDYDGPMYVFGKDNTGLKVTPNHKLLINNSEVLAKDVLSYKVNMTSAILDNTVSFIEDSEIWKACMFQADGSIRKGYKDRFNLCLRKPRKIKKATELLKVSPWIDSRKDSHWSYQKFESNLLSWETKTFNLSTLGHNQALVLYEALGFWDGTRTKYGIRYSTTNKANIDELQAYFARSGYSTCFGMSKDTRYNKNIIYYLDIKPSNIKRIQGKSIVNYSGKVYCVNVDNNYIVVRRNGAVYLAGNCDVESLEAVVLAELSQDKTMRLLYDPAAPKNDIYLYVGAFLPGIKDKILKAGYDPNKPTLEGIAKAKKDAKAERQVAKQCVLGFQYGMGPKKLKASLALEGVNVTEQEAFKIYTAYWDLFKGIKQFNKHLETEWRRRGGWVYNGIGRPVAVYEMFLRDINNRVVQSTGHDILMYVNYQLYLLREQHQINFWPIIIDWHDSSLIECYKQDEKKVLELFNEAYKQCNEWLNGALMIRTKPMIVNSLAESKCE